MRLFCRHSYVVANKFYVPDNYFYDDPDKDIPYYDLVCEKCDKSLMNVSEREYGVIDKSQSARIRYKDINS
ncbi:hypothetical protein HWC08_gp178 [Lactobacillus phage 521B]|uniref:Uncharacterized protein n=1 Tax=Lactobacillus phage 521B TaxID=2510942 RepID=A0A4Y5FEI7_9CAUD|nr:hypothetical protein HWC08_gp178 [Lactobacillus phage 521B]QBJ03463.1 hypothetical protein B521_0113 [Lactobacillus phage 521B]